MRFDPRIGRDRQLVEIARAQGLLHLQDDHATVGEQPMRDASGLRQRLEPGYGIGELRIAEVPNGTGHEEREESAGITDPAHVADDGEPLDQPERSQSNGCVFPGAARGEALEVRPELVDEPEAAVGSPRFVDQRFEDLLIVLL